MGFDSNKDSLMKKFSTMQREKTMTRKSQNARARMHADKKAKERSENTIQTSEESAKPKVVLYGSVKLFLGTIKSILSAYCEVFEYSDDEKATDFIFEKHIPIVIMDMDPPNDWKKCHDLFTTGKTMYPDIEYIVFHKEKSIATEIEMLKAQGAQVMNKPINQMELIQAIRDIIKKQEK